MFALESRSTKLLVCVFGLMFVLLAPMGLSSVAWADETDEVGGVEASESAVEESLDVYVEDLAAEQSVAEEVLEPESIEPVAADAVTFERLWGQTALDTMERIVERGYASSDYAILATNAGYWDALAASGLAGLYQCPIILTEPNKLSNQARRQLTRLHAKNVFIVGGEKALSNRVKLDAQALGCKVERLWGRTAEFTAAKIYEHGKGMWGRDIFFTTVNGYWDALSIAPYAYARKSPILLYAPPVETHWHSGTTHRALVEHRAASAGNRIILLGGTAAIPAYIENYHKVGDLRLAGDNAYETSLRVANWCVEQGMKGSACGVATGNTFHDALAAGPLCGLSNMPIVLAADGSVQCVDRFIKARNIKQGFIFGGTAAISAKLENRILGIPSNPAVIDCQGGAVTITGKLVRVNEPATAHPSGREGVVYILEFGNAIKLKNHPMKRTSASRAYVASELAEEGARASTVSLDPWESYVGKKITVRGVVRFEQGSLNGGTLLRIKNESGWGDPKLVSVWNQLKL